VEGENLATREREFQWDMKKRTKYITAFAGRKGAEGKGKGTGNLWGTKKKM